MKSIALKINHRQHEDRALWITLLLLLLLLLAERILTLLMLEIKFY